MVFSKKEKTVSKKKEKIFSDEKLDKKKEKW